mmetsp:Transcript_24239/g.36738  ORF Transcript_24239/g.36738 Transcript_24239/m.36738 type:complete len:85 (-) Transcript_24239:127-381(-)
MYDEALPEPADWEAELKHTVDFEQQVARAFKPSWSFELTQSGRGRSPRNWLVTSGGQGLESLAPPKSFSALATLLQIRTLESRP